MKKMKNNIIEWMISLSVILMIATGCQEQTEVYEEFVVPGGHVYPGLVLNPSVRSGDNRVQIDGGTPMGADVNEIRVFWNYFTDSISYNLNENTPKNIEIEIPGLKEQSYLFTMHTYNSDGDVSVPVELFGKSYGDNYRNSLPNNAIESVGIVGLRDLVVFWSEPGDNVSAYNLQYINKLGEQTTFKKLPPFEEETLITDFGSDLNYNTEYLPEPNAIDTFSTEYKVYEEPENGYTYSKSDWEVIGYSSQHNNAENHATNLIDGDPYTRWHTWKPYGWPHFVTIDLGEELLISKFEIIRALRDGGDGRAFSKFTMEFGTGPDKDNITWMSLGEMDFDPTTDDAQFYSIDQQKARYLRLTGLEGPDPKFQVLGELTLY
jgi:hypothetical protein